MRDCRRVSTEDSFSSLIAGGTLGPEGENAFVSRSLERAVAAVDCTLGGEFALRALAKAFKSGFWNAGGDTVSLSCCETGTSREG